MRRSTLFIVFFSGFFVGIAMASLLSKDSLFFSMEVLAISGMVVGVVLFCHIGWRKYLKIFFTIVVGIALGVVRFLFGLPEFGPDDLAFYRDIEQELAVQGMIVEEVDVRSEKQYFTLASRKIFYNNQWFSVQGKMLVKAPRYPEFFYGDLLQIRCLLRSPPVFEKFSYADVLAKSDVYVTCYKPKITILQRGQGSWFWNLVFQIKNTLSSRINHLFPEPEASIVAGILIGMRRGIPDDIINNFNIVGLTHIVAISGYNITLMITIFGLLFKSFSRSVRFFGVLAGILFFLLLTGFSASVIRAAWMGFFVILALWVGRKTRGLLVLLMSAFVMVFLQPRMLIWDLSFDLSFAATLGLIVVMPFFERYFKKWPAFLSDNVTVTIAAQVFTTPIILYYFGRFSLISPLSNMLFLPLIPFIMLFSFLALVSSFLFAPLASLFAGMAWLFLKMLVIGISWVAKIPYASLVVSSDG